MKIHIEDVLDAAHGWIRFRAGKASVRGRWAGPGEAPVGRDLDIEMEVSEEEIVSVLPASGHLQGPVAQDGDEVVLIGDAERIGDDGIIEFRVGPDVVLLEPVGPLSDVVEGSRLEVRVPELTIYPRDL